MVILLAHLDWRICPVWARLETWSNSDKAAGSMIADACQRLRRIGGNTCTGEWRDAFAKNLPLLGAIESDSVPESVRG
jgi:hypothetical protein